MGRGRFQGLIFFVLTLLVWGAFLPIGEFEGTEARRSVIARNMVQSGNYVLPTLGGEATLTKPPLHYQFQALLMRALGPTRVAARLPSLLLFALFFALLSRFLAQLGYEPRERWWVFAFLLFHPLLFKFGISAEMDGSFTALSGIALLLLTLLIQGGGGEKKEGQEGSGQALAFFGVGVIGGLAILIKGPMAPVLFMGPVIFLLRRRRFVGVSLWFVGLFLPILLWLGLLFAQGMDGAQLLSIWERETVGRNQGFPLWHFLKGIPGFLLMVFAMGFPPLLLFLGGWRRPQSSADPRVKAMELSFGFGIFLLLFMPHRPTRYVLPALLPGLLCLLDYWRRGVISWAASTKMGRDPALSLRLVFGGLGFIGGMVLLFVSPPWMSVLPWALFLLPLGAAMRGPRWLVLALGACAVLFLGVDRKAWTAVPKRSPVGGVQHLEKMVGNQPLFAWGHVPPLILWKLGPRVRQSEFFVSPYRGEPWILWEEGVPGEHPFPGKTKRIERFRVGRKTLILSKRTPQ